MARRKAIEAYEYLWGYFGIFFWQTCFSCGVEFVRERGWRALVGPWCGGRGREIFLCRSCAPDKQSASRLVTARAQPPSRPPPPPRPSLRAK